MGLDTMRQGRQFIPGPASSVEREQWLAEMKHWRQERLFRLGYRDDEYRRPELAWTRGSFIQPQMMIEDRYFFDPITRQYTVDRYLDDLEQRYGGIDSVLIWPTYPNIGIDNRNQFDMWRDMPGGIAGLREMTARFHQRGVRVFFPVMPWDHGTRDEGESHWVKLAQLLAEIGADGLNGDTLFGVPAAFREATTRINYPLAVEPENGLEGGDALAWNTLSWGYWEYSFVPVVSAYKWLETRHMVHVCRRWGRNKTDDLQHAFFNGVGYESWENVWGIWNGITPRDAEALRRIATVERAFASLLVSPDWEPHTPTVQHGIFASKFPGEAQTLWTLVNRNEYDVHGEQLRVPHVAGTRYYDIWHGLTLEPRIHEGLAILDCALEAKGFGALLATTAPLSDEQQALVTTMHKMAQQPLNQLSQEWKFLPQQIVDIERTRPVTSPDTDMVYLPADTYDFVVSGIEIEGSNDVGVDIQYPWENSPRRHHRHTISMTPFFIDRYPVTNAQFKLFLDATGYHPADDHNFLRDWQQGSYPQGWENKPVTWVSLEDARAYAAWAGKRLPHEWEWQYAAQGNDARLYPWGNDWMQDAVPTPEKGKNLRPPTDVDAYPLGASPAGVMDLVGNVWQWTDEYQDEHTRAAVVRGGSYYQPQGSFWYFPQAYQLTQHGKYLLMAPGRDRVATIGFRCVVDAG